MLAVMIFEQHIQELIIERKKSLVTTLFNENDGQSFKL